MAACTSPFGIAYKAPGAMRPERDAPILYVRCNKCMACRLDHARNWSTRIVHEASRHDQNCFVTLTYSDENLPDDMSVSKRDCQLWLKRLRKELGHQRIRYFLCGEYGGKTKRPHYHAILFGIDFLSDRYPWETINGFVHYRSPLLEKTWPLGHSTIAAVSKQSAGYVARYSVKKANDFTASGGDPYTRLNAVTGEFYQVKPEFLLMSRHPGIGFDWIDKYAQDAFPSGFLIVDGKRVPVPAAYRRRLLKTAPDSTLLAIEASDQAKWEAAKRTLDDNTPERMAVKAELHNLRVKQLKRDFD